LEPGGGLRQLDGQLVVEVVAADRARAPAATGPAGEEVLEDVLEERAEARVGEAAERAAGAVPVVLGALVGVGEDGVGLVGLLEALLGLLVPRVAVRVVLHGQAAVRLLDLVLGGVARD